MSCQVVLQFFVLGCKFRRLIFLQCIFLPKKTRGSSKLEKIGHTLFCCCCLACWKCSPVKVLPYRLWNCWLRAIVWYIVMQLGALSGCYERFEDKSFCLPLVTFHFLRHTRCEFMESMLIEKVLIRYLLFLCVMKFCSTTKNSSPQWQFGFKVISACSKARQWSSVRSWEGQPKKLVQLWGCQSLRLRKSVYSKFLFQVKDLWETGQSTIIFFLLQMVC